MSEEKIIEETIELVKEAQKPGVFNLADAIKGRAFPEKEVTVYTDSGAAFELVQLEDEMNRIGSSDQKKYDELEAKAQELAQKVKDSALVFTMRGVGQGIVENITQVADATYKGGKNQSEATDEWFRFYVTSLVAKNIVKVTDGQGNVDEREFSYEDILEVRNNLPADSWGLLVATMQQLTLASGFFKGLTDAGFLPKS
jgi:hypothetical protein